jgi:hypothetical protein
MKSLIAGLFCLFSISLVGQGIKGHITDNEGEPLPFASIYVKEAGTGTSSNEDGYYELPLPPGMYQITYQYLGYAAESRQVRVGASGFTELNIRLLPQSILLNTVTVTDGAEDPAYTIMRKAISKAKFHLLQANSYSAQVYTKGSGRVKKIPWGFRGMLKKEGVDTNRVFTSESVSEIYFEQPNTFKEKILSIRTSGENDQNASPNAYINSSFYLPKIVESISPLSPAAFRYYRFKFLGTFQDRGHIINKIQVIPRSRGEYVFDGVIYIRENYWNIHSLELNTTIQGFDLRVAQIFGPVKADIWMPVTQKYRFAGSFLGFEVVYDYLASVSHYEVTPNPDLSNELIIIDEKIEPVPEEVVVKNDVKRPPKETLNKDNEKLTRKQLNELIEEYEEEEFEEEEDIVSDYWYSVDSTARKKDSAYWAKIRPVPLSEQEKVGYKIDDSTYVAEQNDSLKKQEGARVGFGDLFFGNTYALGKQVRFDFPGFLPEFRFNTVEGFNLDFTGTLWLRNDTTWRLRITPNARYGFASERFYGKLAVQFGFGKYPRRSSFLLEGGSYISQFHPNAINPLINSIWTLVFSRNYMKLFDRNYGKITYVKQMGYKHQLNVSAEYATRFELFNTSTFSFFRPGENWYEPNLPVNIENESIGGFSGSSALKTSVSYIARPWMKFRRYNGKKYAVRDGTPSLRLTWNSGWNNIAESAVDFQQLELGFTGDFKLGVRATIDVDAEVGTFLNNNSTQFMDVKHFDGGLTELAPLDVTGNYRLLDYYLYSTQNNYASLLTHIRFRKFLLTQIPIVRISGVKENLFINYLKTDFSPHYVEVGYTIDQIFRIARVEFVQSFHGFEPAQFGVRIGISTLFSDN